MTVAIPVLNGGPLLREVLGMVRAQRVDREVELLVADSGSTDGSEAVAREHGAEVVPVPPGDYSHGGTRRLLGERARGAHVAFLTQDAVPADDGWLAGLLAAFELDDDVALAYGPYRPRPDASPMVRRELDEFFAALAPDGRPRVDRGAPPGPGPHAFFTDANGCVSASALRRVPFRDVPYAEDQRLARDMLAAGYAKVYVPGAAVVHSHEYRPAALLRRAFDEGRGLRDVHGWRAPASPIRIGLTVQRQVRDDVRQAGLRLAPAALVHHTLRAVGAALGTRAPGLPPRIRRALSLEGRS